VERVSTDLLLAWFVGLLLTDSHGKSRRLGLCVMLPVVTVEVLGYGFSLVGNSIYEVAPLLKILVLLPFVWLLFESVKPAAPRASGRPTLKPSAAAT